MNRILAFRTAIVAAAALALSACGINSVPTKQEAAKAKWGDVEAAFQERANLIPNLEQIVMSSAEQERETLNAVVQARASATRPEIKVDDLTDPQQMQQYQQAQNTLGGALSRLLVSVERYPELKSQENFGRFMTQIEGQENRIRVAIRDYNEAVRDYNTEIRTFPSSIGANVIHGAKPMTPYEAVTPGAEVAPELNMRSGSTGAPAAGANDNASTDAPAAVNN